MVHQHALGWRNVFNGVARATPGTEFATPGKPADCFSQNLSTIVR